MRAVSKRIDVIVELDPQTPWDDVKYQEAKIRRLVGELCPDANVKVRAGELRWFDPNDDWSRAA